MSNNTLNETRKPRPIKVRTCLDRRYETIELVTEQNESQSSVTAFTREEAVAVIAALAAHLEKTAR